MKILNGKKTIIAAVLGIVCSIFVLLTGEDIHISPDRNVTVQNIIALLTIIFGGAGLAHKAIKNADAAQENIEIKNFTQVMAKAIDLLEQEDVNENRSETDTASAEGARASGG